MHPRPEVDKGLSSKITAAALSNALPVQVLPTNVMIVIYQSLFHSHLNYWHLVGALRQKKTQTNYTYYKIASYA